jgi:hypothetical protein
MSVEHDVLFVPSQYPTIMAAIDAVVRPSTIMISPGVYAEDLRVVGKESLVIESARLSRRGVTLTGHQAESVLEIEGSVVHLSGIEIRTHGRARAIEARDSLVNLQECVLAGNRAREPRPFGAGMLCRNCRLKIQKSTIAGNVIDGSPSGAGAGLHVVDCRVEIAGSSIQTNELHAAAVARGAGIWCERSRMRMWRSRVTDNALYAPESAGGGIYFQNAIDVQLGGSVITGNGSAEGRGGGVFVRGERNGVTIHRNTFVRQNHPDDVFFEESPGDLAR